MFLLALGSVGLRAASADEEIAGADIADGPDQAPAERSSASHLAADDVSSPSSSESRVLETAAMRDISRGIQEIAEEEAAARAEAEEAQREAVDDFPAAEAVDEAAEAVPEEAAPDEADEASFQAEAEVEEEEAAAAAARAEEDAAHAEAVEAVKADAYAREAPVLADVDFTCGRDAFVEEWAARIDAYLSGSPLAGYGSVFAEAAWEYGVDPRWSPAISNTESSKGLYCFARYNAWGWMSGTNWTSWEEAIYAHVRGLASGYGYTISLAAAQKYCPPNYENWYANTLREMARI